MHRATRSIVVFGVYLLITSAVSVFVPRAVLALIGISPEADVILRMLGIALGVMGLFYLAAARGQVVPFFQWTVWGRFVVATGQVVLVALGLAPPAYLAVSTIDALGAVWTWARCR
jgi:hypothetical protein